MEEKTYVFTKKQLNFEKNQIISKFASIASHDLKNCVGGLSNIAYYLSKSLKVENETQKKMLDLLAKEVGNLNKRITEILDMTRVKQVTKKNCDLQSIILLSIAENQVAGVTIDQRLISAQVHADPEKMKQAFNNILTNAKEAMKNMGRIQIDMQIISDTVITTISDSGTGMSPEILEQCFDPMFSTKIARATGMGLPVAQQIIEMHNGTIKVTSEPLKGTTVIISLPLKKN
ncbi:MAG: HAMP domain-containing histidine kinase [Endomicrobiaceae bacterium]|nr:HAMP domain-containing histidine kinase [Endomicrobiaceae bacterium]